MSRSARSRAPASASAASIDVVGRAVGRDVVAERQLEADEVLEDRRHAGPPAVDVELAEVDAVDLDRAAVGSYSRQSSFASVVLPAPFCPTMASEVPAGIVRSKLGRGRGVGARGIREA